MNPWIQTRDAHAVDLTNPDLSQVTIDEVAHALSCINRYNGHTKVPYSVAQHSVFVSYKVPAHFQLQALMHDAHEAFIGDVVSPVQKYMAKAVLPRDAPFAVLRRDFDHAIYRRFMPLVSPAEIDAAFSHIRNADLRALMTERRDLHNTPPQPWDIEVDQYPPYPDVIEPIADYRYVRTIFIARFKELGGQE